MADFDPDKPRQHREVIIEDLRHRRDAGEQEPEEDSGSEPPAAAAQEAETPPVKEVVREIEHDREEKAAEALEEMPVVATGAEGATSPAEPAAATETAAAAAGIGEQDFTEDELRAMEREQLRQIISLGLVNYLKYQLTMVLNFALLSLGSAPDPVTGLVAKDLPQAKLAIDVLEFMVARLQGEMSVAERQQMAQLVSDLKYSFMQAAADGAPPAGGIPGGAAGEA